MPTWIFWVIGVVMETLLVVVLFTQTRILARLKRLTQRVTEIGDSGDFSARIELSGGGEVGLLEASLNDMLSDLQNAREREETTARIYRAIMDNLPIGVSYRDANLNLVAANPRLRAWFPSIQDNTAVLHRYAFRNRIIRSSKNPHPCELAVRDRRIHEVQVEIPVDGENRLFDIIVCPIFDDTGAVVNVLELMVDVTERERLVTRMQRLERLQAVSLMAAGVAHEINTPLNIMELNTSTLDLRLEKEGTLSPDAVRKSLAAITEQIRRISSIVGHMRELARKEGAAHVVPVDVGTAISNALSIMGHQLEAHGVTCITNLAEGLPHVQADTIQMEQVIINLCVNAMHALETVERSEKYIRLVAMQKEENVVITVEDNGPGLGMALERVFDPFYTTKDPDAGSGLGLSLVQAFITSWHGDIRAENIAGGGARFVLTLLPATPEKMSLADQDLHATSATAHDSNNPTDSHDSFHATESIDHTSTTDTRRLS